MTLSVLLIGPAHNGGESVYMDSLLRHAPVGVQYDRAGDVHQGAAGARCQVLHEVAFNRALYPLTIPDCAFRALRLESPFDLVHVHASRIRLTNRRRTPVVMSEGSSSAAYLGEYLGWDEARLRKGYRRARLLYRVLGIYDRLLTLEQVAQAYVFSNWARRLNIRWGADPAKLKVIYPGFPTPKPVDRADRRTFTFLFVGRDFERKGGFEVVEAFGSLAPEAPDARLIIAGSNPAVPNPDRLIHAWVGPERRRRVLGLLGDLERRGRATVIPWVERRFLFEEVYPQADAVLLPTYAEGFGFTNVEAMSFGLPVITSPVGPGEEIIAAGRTGLLVPPGDTNALLAAMQTLLGDAEAVRRIGAAARADFLARFTVERFRDALTAFYASALGN